MSMRNGREDGASAVEFALIFPLLAMLLFGMITAGLALNSQQQINHAAREAARFGATLPGFPDGPEADTFERVASRAVTTAVRQLSTDDAFICVAYYAEDSDDAERRWYREGDTSTSVSQSEVYLNRSCADVLPGEGPRIQVNAFRDARIEAILFRRTVTMSADAVAVYEVRNVQ